MSATRGKHPDASGERGHGLSPRALLVLFLLAWSLRALHLWTADRAGWFDGLFLDSRLYAESAANLRGDSPGSGAPYLLSPLYPRFLALFPSMGGDLSGPHAALDVRWTQSVLGALTCALVALAAARLRGPRAGWIAGLLAAGYGPAIHADSLLLVAGPSAACLAAALVCWQRSAASPRPALGSLAAGLALGAAADLRPTALLMPAALVALLPFQPGPARTRALRAGALALGTLLAILPFWLGNRRAGESFPITAGGGFNFWVGNHAGADGTFQPPEGYDVLWDPVGKVLAERAQGRDLSYTESGRLYVASTREDIAAAPLAWMKLLARKAWLFLHPLEIPQLGPGFEARRAESWPLRAPLDARWILLLALLSPILARGAPGRPGLGIPLAMVAAHALGVILFFVTARHRLPILPIAMVPAAAALDGCMAALRREPGAQSVRSLALVGSLAMLLVAGSLGFRSAPAIPSTEIAARQRGISLYERGEFAEAERVLRAATEGSPSPKTRVALALVLRELQREAEARRELETALTMAPGDPDATFHLGVLMWETERNGGAARALFERCLATRPGDPNVYFNLGAVELAVRNFRAALAAFDRALELAPADTGWIPEAERGRDLALGALAED